MFEILSPAPPDSILGLNEAFRNDPNPAKVNLSVGVFKDDSGKTPILQCVKQAEQRLLSQESSKSYLPIDGIPEYDAAVREMLFGAGHEVLTSQRAVTAQTPGGTGSLRVAADFLKRSFPQARIWLTKPTWENHQNVFQSAGLQVEFVPYYEPAKLGIDFDAFAAALKSIPAGDIVCLHACCHNPTGCDPTLEQWRTIGDIIQNHGLLPLVDFAYQGFGDGLREDAHGLLELTRPGQELLVCSSFSKNFGLYNERVGALTLIASSPEAAKAALSHIKVCVRTNYSNPPSHGGAVVTAVLSDPALRAQWEQELAAMRQRIQRMRMLLVEKLRLKGVARDFSFLLKQRGMFSYTGLTPMQVDTLKREFGIYIVNSGRINVAGLTESNLDVVVDALAKVLGD
jgi:aspartate/tyrosine/aromatic aminotransferase